MAIRTKVEEKEYLQRCYDEYEVLHTDSDDVDHLADWSDEDERALEEGARIIAKQEGMEPVKDPGFDGYIPPSEAQVGGTHYKDFHMQPSVFCEMNKLTHLESQVVKYVCRSHVGGGEKADPIKDLEKAKHCIDLILEWRYRYVDHPQSAGPRPNASRR